MLVTMLYSIDISRKLVKSFTVPCHITSQRSIFRCLSKKSTSALYESPGKTLHNKQIENTTLLSKYQFLPLGTDINARKPANAKSRTTSFEKMDLQPPKVSTTFQQ